MHRAAWSDKQDEMQRHVRSVSLIQAMANVVCMNCVVALCQCTKVYARKLFFSPS
jgi:hypothetical protein